MSTFNGFVSGNMMTHSSDPSIINYQVEFPRIRIDQFRTLPGRPPPLACFLSHVHSDHLLGLESLKSPFVYCSPATRELLLRLEKYPHRMNFSKGILECRKQTYKHLQTLLKTIPIEEPTKIELSPGNDIQVTLFDANHCIGAVMFLIEGQRNAVLYTGDIRSEAWWVNSLIRSPTLIPYTLGNRRLDMLYLDTTFAQRESSLRDFPSKAEGIRELLEKLDDYPRNTVFYFHAWTFGYEEVWLALTQALQSPVHLDRYRHSLYTSLAKNHMPGHGCKEAPLLCGFKCGNVQKPGCLTRDANVRLHSCEKGTACHVFHKDADVVDITPIISRHEGVDMQELGAGGGQGDLDQIHELDLADPAAVAQLVTLCSTSIKDSKVMEKITTMLSALLMEDRKNIPLDHDFLTDHLYNKEYDDIPLKLVVDLIKNLAVGGTSNMTTQQLPRSIFFPYSRHSSYNELRLLVAAFKPRDIYPCTAPPEDLWSEEMSMQSLFGDLCSNGNHKFWWDEYMRQRAGNRIALTLHMKRKRNSEMIEQDPENASDERGSSRHGVEEDETESELEEEHLIDLAIPKKRHAQLQVKQPSPKLRLKARVEAFDAARQGKWAEIELQSVSRNHVDLEEEL